MAMSFSTAVLTAQDIQRLFFSKNFTDPVYAAHTLPEPSRRRPDDGAVSAGHGNRKVKEDIMDICGNKEYNKILMADTNSAWSIIRRRVPHRY